MNCINIPKICESVNQYVPEDQCLMPYMGKGSVQRARQIDGFEYKGMQKTDWSNFRSYMQLISQQLALVKL